MSSAARRNISAMVRVRSAPPVMPPSSRRPTPRVILSSVCRYLFGSRISEIWQSIFLSFSTCSSPALQYTLCTSRR